MTGLDTLLDWAVRDDLAKAMFTRRCELDDADPALVELAWLDADIKQFWLDEATHVLSHLGITGS